MNRQSRTLLRSAFLFGFAFALAAQPNHITPFTGKWKLNLAKSTFKPGPPFKSFTITFAADGVRHLDLIDPEGHPHKPSLPWSDGKEVSVEGMENTTATSKIEGRTLHDSWKQDGKVIENVHAIVSPNGTILKIAVSGTNNQGRRYHNELTFEKQ